MDSAQRHTKSHGAYRLKSKLEQGKLDLRSSAGQAMKRLRDAFHADLGGNLTTAQKALVDRAITKIMISELVETWTLKQATIISASGELPPVLKQNYLSWSAELRRDLLALGLDRRAKDVPDLKAYLAARATQPSPDRTKPEPYHQDQGEEIIIDGQGSQASAGGDLAASQIELEEEHGED